MNAQLAVNLEGQLQDSVGSFRHDPLGFVLFAFPWGESGTELEQKTGPRRWQRKILDEIGQQLRSNAKHDVWGVIQEAVSSGHGPGKSALVAWLVLWAICTYPDTRGIVTANTDTQLRTKTWPELAKWYHLLICRHWFELTATAIFSVIQEHERTWRIDLIPWSVHRTEAFAGLHNEGKRILVLFDEASAIVDKIWEVTEGALTDDKTELLWCVFGNPTRNTGRFRECFGRLKHRWKQHQIDTRKVEGINLTQIERWVKDYGEDSDFVRIRVRGVFPRASSMQFIDSDLVTKAMQREPLAGLRDPLIMSIDVARGGDDNMVIAYRRGLDAKSIPMIVIPGSETRDSEKVIAKINDLATTSDRFSRPDAIMVDETGIGGPIVDRLRGLLGDRFQVYGVQFAAASPDPKYSNMRAYIYAKLREGLRIGLAIPDDPDLESEMVSIEFTHDRQDRVLLESKEHMKDRGLASPDKSDALAISYARQVQQREQTNVSGRSGRAVTEYDPYARA